MILCYRPIDDGGDRLNIIDHTDGLSRGIDGAVGNFFIATTSHQGSFRSVEGK